MKNQFIQVAIAILYSAGDQFLLQLRDDIPGIRYPGHWGLFGGHLETGETPDVAIERELFEEIDYVPPQLYKFGRYCDAQVIRHVYYAPLTVEVNTLVLKEGWDLKLLTPQQIRQGSCYSAKAAQIRPLAVPSQKILLEFIDRGILGQVSS